MSKKAAATRKPARDPQGPRTAAGTPKHPRSGANKVPGTPKPPAPGAEHARPLNRATGRPVKGGIKVRALKMGFYDNRRVRQGDVFTIAGEADFSRKWMRRVDDNTPERVTTGAQELKKKNAKDLENARAGNAPRVVPPPADADDVIGDDEPEEGIDEHGDRA